MKHPDYFIRTMTRSDLNLAVDWAAREGWNPGLGDGDLYWEADPEGFYMGFLGDIPVSSISLVRYGTNFSFLGFYIVAPPHRGKGYGIKLWRHAMDRAGTRNVGLDGVVDQQANYKKSGFKLAFRNIRFQGKANSETAGHQDVVPLNQVPASEFTFYDRPFFPEDRTRFIREWVGNPHAVSLGIVKNQHLEGYGTIRKCRSGYKIGPLFADSPARADQLFEALTSKIPSGTDLFLDVPEPNAQALEMARTRGMTPCFETARMYTGPFPDLPLDRIFGITSFEVG